MSESYPSDGGPVYAETNLEMLIAEPWNAISSLAIALPSIYWAIKLKWNFKDFKFLYFLMPLLFLGGMGSTFYHAFRSSSAMLVMDVLPTAIVTMSVGIYFWHKLFPKWWQIILIVIPITTFRLLIARFLPNGALTININYLITGAFIFLPVIFYLFSSGFRHARPIVIAVLHLSVSLVFRKLDHSFTFLFPWGSHFLWHLFSGFGAYYIAKYLYLIRCDELALKKVKPAVVPVKSDFPKV